MRALFFIFKPFSKR